MGGRGLVAAVAACLWVALTVHPGWAQPGSAQPQGPGQAPSAASATAAAARSTLDASASLRQANAAAQVGDWPLVDRLVAPLAATALGDADRAELHRLRGLAAFFAQRLDLAEAELLAYLRLDSDAHLDPATVPPEAITYFESVQAKHRAELRTLRALRAPPPKRSFLLTLVPVAGQLQNGDRRKAWVLGATLGVLAAANLSSYVLLRRWCSQGDGTCDRTGVDRTEDARRMSVVNVTSAVGLLVAYGVGVYDAIAGYRRARVSISPTVEAGGGTLSVVGSF